jgi:hypothetical protein
LEQSILRPLPYPSRAVGAISFSSEKETQGLAAILAIAAVIIAAFLIIPYYSTVMECRAIEARSGGILERAIPEIALRNKIEYLSKKCDDMWFV